MAQSLNTEWVALWLSSIDSEGMSTGSSTTTTTRENSPTRYEPYKQPELNPLRSALWDQPFGFPGDAPEPDPATSENHSGESTDPPLGFPEDTTELHPEIDVSDSDGEITNSLPDTAPPRSVSEALFDGTESDTASGSGSGGDDLWD
ncbi:hypothetical protein GGTG_13364 [Gaeumannomyces tritici R3-111a-1]|uniref:Uncharacterized protein n=1 Tax=Gaeumannomyces tritici (strain R3-111a-1) TaxID=644352 RepID=J3PIN5_GAET3|nr:hypothetical protein GGTG_13364 [Gaeumannomyces tritici R3-111a-1]EJT69096.1 hypothetical protein GGTG_13364 [Gaeumannomyces tritici R3-111a-1]